MLGAIAPSTTVDASPEETRTTYSRPTTKPSHKRKARKHKKHSRKNKRIHKNHRCEDLSKNRDENQKSSNYFGKKKRSDRWKKDERQEQNVVDETKNENVALDGIKPEEGDTPAPSEVPEQSSTPSEKPEQPEEQEPSEATSSKAQAALNAVNELREKNGLPALTYNAELGQAAQTVAQGNHDRNGLTHAHDDAAVEASGYTGDSALANIGYNSAGTSAEGAVNQFYGSAGHRKQMLAPYWTEFGYGEVNGPNGTYFTQFFGTQDINDISEFNSYNQYIGSGESHPTVPLNSYNGE